MSADWDDFRFFLAVAETGSLSAAGRALKVAQPTVGRRVQALARRLGVRLFDRLSHGYVLTWAGAEVRDMAQDMEHQALAIERRLAGRDRRLAGPVSIAATETLTQYWLVPRLAALCGRCPGLEPALISGIGAADLGRREADVALRIGDPGPDTLIGRRVACCVWHLYAAPAYLERHGEPSAPGELRAHRVIESVREIAGLRQARELRRLAGEVALRSNNVNVQFAAARAGHGLMALPSYMAPGRAGLRRVLDPGFEVRLDLWLLSHRDLRDNVRVRAVLDYLAEALRLDRESFLPAAA